MTLDVGVYVVVLECRHLRQEAFGRGLLAVDAEFVHGLLGQCLGVLLVKDGKALGIADAVYLAPQELDAERVDGAYEVVDGAPVHQPRDAVFHLLRGLVGERQRQYVAGRHSEFVDQKREPMGYDPGLAAACAGHDTDASLGPLHGLLLLRVQLYGFASGHTGLCCLRRISGMWGW